MDLKIHNIKYDTDGQKIKNLPQKFFLTVDDNLSREEVENICSEHISNESGWCHEGFEMVKLIKVPKILTVKVIVHDGEGGQQVVIDDSISRYYRRAEFSTPGMLKAPSSALVSIGLLISRQFDFLGHRGVCNLSEIIDAVPFSEHFEVPMVKYWPDYPNSKLEIFVTGDYEATYELAPNRIIEEVF